MFHWSTTPPTYPLVLDTSLYHGGATITDAVVEELSLTTSFAGSASSGGE